MKKTILFSVFCSVKVLALQPGEIFWEIAKPGGSAPSYLMGTAHNVVLSKESLPPEVIRALKNSKVGLFEVISSERTEEYSIAAKKKTMWLPSWESLSLYIGEERTQKIFSALQVALSQLDRGYASALFDKWKNLELNINSYEEFNRLRPSEVELIINIIQNVEISSILLKDKLQKLSTHTTKSDEERCFFRTTVMDTYIEEVFSCMEKPVHSIETIENQQLLVYIIRDEIAAGRLVRDFNRIIFNLESRHLSKEDATHREWELFLREIRNRVSNNIYISYYLNRAIDNIALKNDIIKSVSEFLTKKECTFLPDSSINQYAEGVVEEYHLRYQIMAGGKQMDVTMEEQFIEIIDQTIYSKREMFSFCFLNYR